MRRAGGWLPMLFTVFQAGAAAAVCPSGTEVVQAFPSGGGAESEWRLCFEVVRTPDAGGALTASETLVVSDARFTPGAAAAPVEVLGEVRLSEIFVPYDAGAPRFLDLSDRDFDLGALTAVECTGTRLDGNRVCRELVDRGLAWRNPFDDVARRGEKLVLWSILEAGNYDYLMEYGFFDDGTVEVRAAATGEKLRGPDDTAGHTHVFAWRIDLDVAGAGGDTVSVANQRFKSKGVAEKHTELDRETGIAWSADGFTHVLVEDATRTNGRGRLTGYALSPLREGVPRFRERWTRDPLAVTRAKGPGQELRAVDLADYLDKEDVGGADVVLWYQDAHHHDENMRDEDRDAVPTAWVGFRLDPQNLWDGTPHY